MNSTIITISVVMLILLLMGSVVALSMSLTRLSNTVQKISETKKDQDLYTLKHNYSVKDSRDLLEYLVDQKLAEWQIYNVDPSTENYMTEDNMKSCVEYIMKKVMVEMTPIMKDKLSVGYPMDTEEDMLESIKNRAKLAVMNFAVKQNAPQEHAEAIKNINAF